MLPFDRTTCSMLLISHDGRGIITRASHAYAEHPARVIAKYRLVFCKHGHLAALLRCFNAAFEDILRKAAGVLVEMVPGSNKVGIETT